MECASVAAVFLSLTKSVVWDILVLGSSPVPQKPAKTPRWPLQLWLRVGRSFFTPMLDKFRRLRGQENESVSAHAGCGRAHSNQCRETHLPAPRLDSRQPHERANEYEQESPMLP